MADFPRETFEVSSRGYDTDLEGVGGGPDGTRVASTITIPQTALAAPRDRYLVKLCEFTVPEGFVAWIVGVRQAVLIGPPPAQGVAPLLLLQTSPFWRFADGNILWGIRLDGVARPDTPNQFGAQPTPAGFAPGLYDTDTGVLYDPDTDPLIAYRPPAGGEFPGVPASNSSDLGRFLDLRFPWLQQGTASTSRILVPGGRRATFFASVRQTDPRERPALPDVAETALGPEDRLIASDTTTIYRKIAGALIYELAPVSSDVASALDDLGRSQLGDAVLSLLGRLRKKIR